MAIDSLPQAIPGLSKWSHADKIRLFAWYIHTYEQHEHFKEADIRRCYDALHFPSPTNISAHLSALQNSQTKDLIRSATGYRLSHDLRQKFSSKYGERQKTVEVTKLLSELPTKISDLAGRDYLDETLRCFKAGAFRGAVVMAWNLAYDHLCQYVLTKRLADFNSQLPKSFPKADISAINSRDDFAELKESQVLQVCRSAGIITSSLHNLLKEKLNRRNSAAHPSGIQVSPATTEEFIIDLVNNVLLSASLR